MTAVQQAWELSVNPSSVFSTDTEASQWYAIHTRARHEKMVAGRLQEQGVNTFLPLVKETHRWSDRKKIVESPLFSCYVFAQFNMDGRERQQICRTDGVLQIVGMRGEGISIPNEQIETVRALVSGQMPWSSHPFLKVGQRVRVRGGAMDGVEGIFVARNGDRTIVVSVDAIQRSLAVRIEGYQVEPL